MPASLYFHVIAINPDLTFPPPKAQLGGEVRHGRGGERVEEAEAVDNYKEAVFSRPSGAAQPMDSWQLGQHAQDLPILKQPRKNPSLERQA